MNPDMLLPPAPPRCEYRFGLAPSDTLVGEARAVTRTTADLWRLPEATIDDAVLVVSELATNAQRACPGDRLGLLLKVDDPEAPGALRIGVWDPEPAVPRAAQSDLWSESGRGLLIVASLAVAHGVLRPEHGGKIVWADLRVPRTTTQRVGPNSVGQTRPHSERLHVTEGSRRHESENPLRSSPPWNWMHQTRLSP